MPPSADSWELHILSDATGHLASHIANSVLTQFPERGFKIHYHPFVRKEKDLRALLESIRQEKSLVLHRLLRPDHKALAHQRCQEAGIPEFDLTGGVTAFLAQHTGFEPANDPEKLHPVDERYFLRIRAMEFTAQHDDNRRLESLEDAEIVIVGLSRVSKSPTSTWLGSLGYMVANVAVSPETGFPRQLEAVLDRTVAFTMRPKDLWEIRQRRFSGFREKISKGAMDPLPYDDLRSVVREVSWAEKEYRQRGYPILDITGQTVEELAARVITTLRPEQKDLLAPAGRDRA